MWIYLLLASGLFMGWSLGTNDAANAFGTAVATRVVKYRHAVIIISVMVMIGAILLGDQSLEQLSSFAVNNKITPTEEEVNNAIANGLLDNIKLKSALKAAIVFICGGLTVFVMSYLKFPVSANQSIQGAIIGWGLCYADYSNAEILQQNLKQIVKFVSTWFISPLGAGIISFVLVFLVDKFIAKKLTSLRSYDLILKIGYIGAGALAAFSIGQNSSASVTAYYYSAHEGANLLSDPKITAILGGIAISIGVLTYSKKVMMTVGSSIAEISQIDGFLVIIAMAACVLIIGDVIGIPVSTSQACVGAVVGAGLYKNPKSINLKVLKNIGLAWLSSPTVAGVMAYIVAICTKSYFG